MTELASGIFMLPQIPSAGPDGKIISKHFGGDSWPLAHLGWDTVCRSKMRFAPVTCGLLVGQAAWV